MAVIYDISTGKIHTDATSQETAPCDAYMSVIRELLKEL
jgi:hypothetical protein